MKDKLIVVGDAFKTMTDDEQVITLNDAIYGIHVGSITNACLTIERSVSEEQLNGLKAFITVKGLAHTIMTEKTAE